MRTGPAAAPAAPRRTLPQSGSASHTVRPSLRSGTAAASPHNDPHSRKTVNPRLGRGSVTNQEAPEANTTAEWKTTSPATTNPRITSNSGRRPAERPDIDCPAAVRAAAGAGSAGPLEPDRPARTG